MSYRSFIAVEIPDEVHGAIVSTTLNLQRAVSRSLVRWVEPKNIHLTLKFLGDVSPADLEHMADALKAELSALKPFEMSVGGLGAFPDIRRPRVIWVGLKAPAALAALQHAVEAVASRFGFSAEQRPFSPHLTIGRVGQHLSPVDLAKIKSGIESTTVGDLGCVWVEAVVVFKSDLRPGGAVYTPLYYLPLKSLGSMPTDH
jgi:2'-5' RNA ligase